MLSNLRIDIIKNVEGEFDVEDIVSNFQNFFFNKSRMGMNLSASINGTGFMVKKDFFEKLIFQRQRMSMPA